MSFRLKVSLGVAAMQAIMFLTLIWSGLHSLHTSNETEMIARASTTAKLFATLAKDAVLSMDLASLDSFVAEVLSNPGVVYAECDRQHVLAQDGDPEALSRPFERDQHFADVDDGIFDTYAEIAEAEMTFGRVEIGLSITTLQSMFMRARQAIVGLAALEILVMAICSLIFVGYLTRKLTALKNAVQQVAGGAIGPSNPRPRPG